MAGAALPAGGDLVSAIIGAVAVMLVMMVGSGVGEQVAGFFFGRIQGGLTQMIYLFFFLPLFVVGGYVYTLIGIPQTSLSSSALFFGLWGFFTVFVSRFLINQMNKVLRITIPKSDKREINGKELIAKLKARNLDSNEVRKILRKCCDSDRKADKIFEGGTEWVRINPEALAYELSKRGYNAQEVIDVMKNVLRMKPEEAAMIWKNSSV